jgi:pilus assembly protein CpaF
MSDKDKDSLLGLFSTRSTQHRPIDTSRLLPSSSSADNSSGGTSAPVSRATSTPEASASIARSAARAQTANQQQKSQLGALANTIMREARRELGSDVNLQQAEKSGVAVSEQNIADAVDKVLRRRGEVLDDIERANVIIHLQKDLLGWGVLQPLIDNREVTDIHVYDWQTVVLQRGKVSETTGIHWPNHQAYVAFLDRLLLRLGKSLSTQQHTVDASFPNGIRICVVHESVCGARGPLLCIRVPRIMDVSLDSLVTYQVAPPLIVQYLGSLVKSGLATFMIAGETGTGKTTLLKCLGTQFGPDESIVAVEDTPEVNIQHPYFRSLVSRPANVEGVGEVTLQEHIKTTLRMTPTRVILGEMRTPFSAEAFLESAQTGHVGMSTIHARNARETLVRLESLLGRAQKSVAIDIIRQQIALAVDVVVWLHREKSTGKPRVGEIVEVGHFVEGTIQVRPMFSQIQQGENPLWKVDSWSSGFDEVLSAQGIRLGDMPPEIGFNTTTSDTGRRNSR